MNRIVKNVCAIILLAALCTGLMADEGELTIAVMEFENNSGLRELEHLKKGIRDMITTDLLQIDDIKMVERSRIDKILEEIDLSKTEYFDKEKSVKIGKLVGASYLLTGSYILNNNATRIDVRLVNVENGEIVYAEKAEGKKDDFFEIEKNLVSSIITKMKPSVSAREMRRANQMQTENYDAFDTYSKAIYVEERGNMEEAMTLMSKAANDSSFKMAQEKLSEFQSALFNNLKALESMDNSEEALNDIFEDSLLLKLYKIQVTDIRLGSDLELKNGKVSLVFDYSISFNKKEYDVFQNRLSSFLDIVAKHKIIYTSKHNSDWTSRYYCRNYEAQKQIWKESGLPNSEKNNYRCISLETVKGDSDKKLVSSLYLVRKEVFDLLRKKVIKNTCLVFSFITSDKEEARRMFLATTIDFGGIVMNSQNQSLQDYQSIVYFSDWGGEIKVTNPSRQPLSGYAAARRNAEAIEKRINDEFKRRSSPEQSFSSTLSLPDVPRDYLKQLEELRIYLIKNEDNLSENERQKKADEIEKKYWSKSK